MSVKYKYRAMNNDSCNFSRFKEIKKIQFLFISTQIALIPVIL